MDAKSFLGSLAIVLALAGCYANAGEPVPTTANAQSVTAATYAYGPAETYRAYQDTLMTATSLDAVTPFLSARHRAALVRVPPQEEQRALLVMRETAIPGAYIRSVGQDGDTATLEAVGATRRALVTLRREGGLWRVDQETWTMKVPAPAPAPLPSQP